MKCGQAVLRDFFTGICLGVVILASVLLAPDLRAAEKAFVVSTGEFHLGTPGFPEWSEFAGKTPHGRRLDLKFSPAPNATEQTLFLRQRDVKFGWNVLLNGKKIGALVTQEAALIHAIAIPAGALMHRENTLSIVPPTATDDIVVGDFRIDPRPLAACLGEASLDVQVVEAGRRVPCRITITDASGALAAMSALPSPAIPSLALGVTTRPGVVYTRDGRARLGLLPGDYTVYASRGFEYSVSTQRVAVVAGRVAAVNLAIAREVPTPGLVAADTHIHTLTHSKHGDATLDERMLTIAGEGIELAVATDHNHHADYSEAAVRTRLQSHFTPIIGNEVTTKAGHFNAFPIQLGAAVVDHRIEDWPALMTAMRATPGVQVITLNHPRDLHSNFIPLGPTNFNAVSGENRRGPDFTFDALEVITSAAMQSDIQLLFRDWFALLNHGRRITAIGSSDSHDVSRFIVGQGRTYVACSDADPAAIDVAAACRSLRDGRALVSLGLLANLRIDGRFGVGDLATNLGPEISVEITVLGPAWTGADRVELFANGVKIREQTLVPTTAIEKARLAWKIPRPAHDAHLVAIASGPGVRAPFWEIPRPYQPSTPIFTPRVLAATNPVWLDADGDGRFTAARGYAQGIIASVGTEPARLLAALGNYDRAVATQAASLCRAAGVNIASGSFRAAFKSAAPVVAEAFAEFAETLHGR